MDYTVQEFKDFFPKDFPYLSNEYWDASKQYFAENTVYLESNGLFYKALQNNVNSNPTTNPSDWVLFEDTTDNYVTDDDIQRAYDKAEQSYNEDFSDNEDDEKIQFMYLTAHYLCLDLRITGLGYNGLLKGSVNSVSVGSVSESYNIPEYWLKSPFVNFYTWTSYGQIYLQMVFPKLVGNVSSVKGATHP